MLRSSRARTLVLVCLASLAWTGSLVAQEAPSLNASEAEAFLGTWVLTMETPRGTNEQNLSVTDVYGKVVAELSGGRGGSVTISDISKSEESLVLKFEGSFRGNARPVVLTLSLDGETLKVNQDMGQFSMSGTGKKQM